MDVAEVMDELAARLGMIAGLRVFAWPPGSVTPPAAIVSYPERVDFDSTYGRGMDRMTVPVAVVVGRPADRATRDSLAAYCGGGGARSVKAALDRGFCTAWDSVRVVRADTDVVSIGGVDYLAALFSIEISGTGD